MIDIPIKIAVARRYVLLATVFFMAFTTLAQNENPLQKELTIVEDEISMVDLLNTIEKNSAVYFSYSPDFFEGEFVKVKFVERTVEYILGQLLKPRFTYLANGNEIIIYKNRNKPDAGIDNKKDVAQVIPDERDASGALEENGEEEPVRVKTDTVYVTRNDTVERVDTLMVHDTVVIRDTVFIKKAVKKPYKDKSIFRNTTLSDIRNKKYYLELYAGSILTNISFEGANQQLVELYENAYKDKISYEAGLAGGRHFGAFSLETGLGIRHVRERFSYTFSRPPETYYEVDTLDSYYTIENQDTTWYHVTDSSLKTIPGYEKQYRNMNYFTYLEIPLYLAYNVRLQKWTISLEAGIINGFLINKGGYYIANRTNNPADSFDDLDLNPYTLSGAMSLGAVFYINDSMALSGGIRYSGSMKPIFKDKLPVGREYRSISGKVGVRYLF